MGTSFSKDTPLVKFSRRSDQWFYVKLLTERQTDRQTGRQTDRQTDRRTDKRQVNITSLAGNKRSQ